MKEYVYCPKHRILTVLEDGFATVSFTGDAAERKFTESLNTGAQVSIVGGNFRPKAMPVPGITQRLKDMLEASTQRVTVKRREQV
jgi:hypothetical protein